MMVGDLRLGRSPSRAISLTNAPTVEQRLLMTHDRFDADTFLLTQELLGQMLGVQRPTVSIAASMLHKAGLLNYARGKITIHRPCRNAARVVRIPSCHCGRIRAHAQVAPPNGTAIQNTRPASG